jgi:ribosomal protein S28E/S33
MRATAAAAAIAIAAALPSAASAGSSTSSWTMAKGVTKHVVTVVATTGSGESFDVRLKVSHGRRVRLELRNASGSIDIKSLMDSKTCARHGAYDICTGAFEPLPPDTYRFIARKSKTTPAAKVSLRVTW